MAENKPPIIWSREARADLGEIWNYYLQIAGPRTAEKIIRDIGEASDFLQQHPFGGRVRNEVRPDLRSFAIHPHILFYRIVSNVAEIVRVLDGRRDIEQMFADDLDRGTD